MGELSYMINAINMLNMHVRGYSCMINMLNMHVRGYSCMINMLSQLNDKCDKHDIHNWSNVYHIIYDNILLITCMWTQSYDTYLIQ